MNTPRKRSSVKTLLIYIVVFLFLPYSSYAQYENLTDEQRDLLQRQRTGVADYIQQMEERVDDLKKGYIEITTNPEYPEPNENVEVKLVSSLFDFNRAKTYWYVDGTLIKSGTGIKKIDITSGDTGENTKIKIIIDTIEGDRIEKHTEIMPIEMTLLWQADTYTPPFYKGKALLSPNSVLKIIATPSIKLKNGNTLDPNKLVYVWKGERRDSSFSDGSGYGKNVFYTEGSRPYGRNIIKVEVSSLDNSIKSGKRMELELNNPNILFYEDDPLKGVLYGKAIKGRFDLEDREIPIKIEPYFFSKKDKDVGNLTYEWYVSGKKVSNSGQKATFKQVSKDGVGFSKVRVTIKNIYRRFQQASGSFILDFNRHETF